MHDGPTDEKGLGDVSLFRNCSRTDLLNKYFNLHPLFIPGAIESPESLLGLDGFYAALAHTENVRAVFNSMHRASIAPNDAPDMLAAGATICATGIDLAVPAIRDLVKRTRKDLSYLGIVSANAYCSPAGAGFSKHYDPRVVTVVQLLGTKDWEYSSRPVELNPFLVDYSDQNREEVLGRHNEQVGTASLTLAPGDILCLPGGTVHEARAGSLSLSLNIAFDYIGKGAADLVTSWLQRELVSDRVFREACFLKSERHLKVIEDVVQEAEFLLSRLRKEPSMCLPQNDD